ncbi:MAG: DUF2953 domain-containing protein [Clostridium sp.]|jgi:hypothetical protein|nr:DUF2953 domain-containing protein [Clostridium sp.]
MMWMMVGILRIMGTLLLALLGLALFLVLSALFLPVVYRAGGSRSESGDAAGWFQIRWLFGFFRMDYRYPKPGKLTAKILFFPLYDSGKEKILRKKKPQTAAPETAMPDAAPPVPNTPPGPETLRNFRENAGTSLFLYKTRFKVRQFSGNPAKRFRIYARAFLERASQRKIFRRNGPSRKIFLAKKGFPIRAMYAKIKHIPVFLKETKASVEEKAALLRYDRELFRDKETRLLFRRIGHRLFKVLKHIRPRKVRAQIRFGTGSPDTTGYVLGIYGMVSPLLGKHIAITPDFEETVLTGSISAAGHALGWILLLNALKLILDKQLRSFLDNRKTR